VDDFLQEAHSIFGEMEPEPIDPDQVIDGDPQAFDLTISETDEGREVAGLWMCTPGTFSDTEQEEAFVVIRGHAEVEMADGTRIALGPGSTHSFRASEETVWKVTQPLVKCYWARPGKRSN
jgi:uncharacterized cupin superfamily protein